MVLGKLDSYMQKNETWPLSHTIHKDKLQMDEDLHVRQESIKILEENIGCNLFDIGHSNFFHDTSPKARETEEKNELVGLHQDKKLLHSQGNSQKNLEAAHGMEEEICKWHYR